MWVPGMEDPSIVSQYEDLGVSRLIVPLMALVGEEGPVESLKRFGDEVLAKL